MLPVPPIPDVVVPAIDVPTSLSVDQVLSPYIWVFYASFLVSILLTPVMRSIAIAFDVVDRPDGLRKMHREPVAYLGGVAMFTAWLVGVVTSQFVQWHVWQPHYYQTIAVPVSIALGAMMAFLLGVWDDLRGIKPRVKIIGQVSAAVVLLSGGIGTGLTKPFVDESVVRWNRLAAEWLTVSPELATWIAFVSSAAATIAIVVFCCNASNLMDGLDGLCGGVTAIIALGFLVLSVGLAMAVKANPQEASNDALRVVIAFSLLGASLGFVMHNFNPASIFMGDAGSLFLGFICALLIIMLGEADPRYMLGAMVMFALPVLDTALAFARRWLAGRPLFSADKLHVHHQLIARGMTVKQAVLAMYGLAVGFVALGSCLMFLRVRYAVAVYIVIFGAIVVAAFKMGMVHERVTAATSKPEMGGTGLPEPEPEVKLETDPLGDDSGGVAAVGSTGSDASRRA